MKKILILVMAAVLVFSFAGCGNSGESDYEAIEERGTLKIGYTVYEPMNYFDGEGNFVGFDTEFAELVCEELGVEAEFIEIAWDTKTIELESKEIDCIWNGMTITPELEEATSITTPYVKNMQVMVVKKDSGIESLEDASGKNITAELGSTGEDVVQETKEFADSNYVGVSKQTDGLLEVKSGSSDVVVLDYTLAKAMVGPGTDYEDLMIVDGVELSVEEYGIAFRKGSDLTDMVNEIIANLISDGTLPALAEKYELNLVE